ncbi:hypothetical protein C4J83_3907 [Pseudomonas sp. LBUM920]|nr:hypothetical protein C4J83_3907 [Pseudomonas sp. LBUM920]
MCQAAIPRRYGVHCGPRERVLHKNQHPALWPVRKTPTQAPTSLQPAVLKHFFQVAQPLLSCLHQSLNPTSRPRSRPTP